MRVARAGAAAQARARRIKLRLGKTNSGSRRDGVVHHSRRADRPDTLPDDPDLAAADAARAGELHAENDKLRLLIQRLLAISSVAAPSNLTADQLQFGLEDLEQTVAENQAAQDAADTAGDHAEAPRIGPTAITARCPGTCRVTRW